MCRTDQGGLDGRAKAEDPQEHSLLEKHVDLWSERRYAGR